MKTSVICDAIKNRRVLSFSYEFKTRRVEPHLLGHDKDGDLTLSCWQLSGGSGTGFRDFHVAKLTALSITEDGFEGPRRGYNPNDKTMSRILCRL